MTVTTNLERAIIFISVILCEIEVIGLTWENGQIPNALNILSDLFSSSMYFSFLAMVFFNLVAATAIGVTVAFLGAIIGCLITGGIKKWSKQ